MKIQVFLKTSVLKNVSNFRGKHLCCKTPQLLKGDSTQVFSFKTFYTEQLQWLVFKICSNSNNLFNDISYTQPISDKLLLSQLQTNLKMHSLTKNVVRQSVFVTNLEQIPFLLKFDLNITNFAVLVETYFSLPISLFFSIKHIFRCPCLYFFRSEHSLLYQATQVFIAFTERIAYHFCHKCAIQH